MRLRRRMCHLVPLLLGEARSGRCDSGPCRGMRYLAHGSRRTFLHSRLRIRARRALRTMLPELLCRTSALSRRAFLPLCPWRGRKGIVTLSKTRQGQGDRQHQAGRCHPPRFGFPRHNRSPRFQFLNFLGATTASRSGPRQHPAAPADRPAHRNWRKDLRSYREPGDHPPQFPTERAEQEATGRRR